MITLLRRQAHGLRAVLRRSVLGITHRGPVAPIVFTAADGQLCARHRHPYLSIEHATRVAWPSSGVAALPLDALAEVEGRDDSILALDPIAPDRTVVRWSDRGIPRVHEYTVPTIEAIGAFPDLPGSWSEVPADLINALAEATATSADDDTRYALSCLQLKAGPRSHEVVATDGRQILIRGGFLFPWTGDVLVRRSPLFASRELRRDRPWAIGRTETHVALRCDPWTILLEIQTSARFPRVDMALPTPDATTARLRLDPADASFLTDTLGRLPGSEIHNAPVTVDLNGRVAVRARGSESDTTTELILSRSSYGGSPVRFQTNRDFLARAVRIGFREIEVVDANSPIVCRAGDRSYAWQPLDAESALAPNEEVTRIESHLHQPQPPRTPETPVKSSQPVNERIKTEEATTLVREAAPTRPEVNHDVAATGLVALIREAESLHEALGEARARSQKLVVALRRQRKQARLMAATLNTLRQLKLQEVAG
jgi:hypothetical protein